MTLGRLFRLAPVGLLVASVASAGEIRSVRDFEGSAFSQTYRAKSQKSWPLRSGGTNFSYSYADSESDSSAGLEMSPDANRITHYGVSWHGESKQQPATLTPKREKFLRTLLASVNDRINGDAVVVSRLMWKMQGRDFRFAAGQ
jgi:hypothetical protein